MERALREDRLAARSAHPALEGTSAVVRKMLEQTGRNHVAHAPDARKLCALEIPARLWRALGEAGPRPHTMREPDLSERWWLVEVEAPGDDEPNAIALWESDGTGAPFVTVVTWRTSTDGERSRSGLAALRGLVHIGGFVASAGSSPPSAVDDPENSESRAGTQLLIDTLVAPDSGPIARAKTAIALHLASDGRAAPLASYRPNTAGARARGEAVPAGQRAITALFALERAPEPEPAEEHTAGEGHLRAGGGGRLRARHHVRAHWKRQAFGPRLTRRRWIVVEGYARGFAPQHDRLFALGDLVDRGPQSVDALAWMESGRIALSERGNHEQMLLRRIEVTETHPGEPTWTMHPWFARDIEHADWGRWKGMVRAMPIAVTVHTRAGAIGLVHATPTTRHWDTMLTQLADGDTDTMWLELNSTARARGRVRSGCALSPSGNGLAEPLVSRLCSGTQASNQGWTVPSCGPRLRQKP